MEPGRQAALPTPWSALQSRVLAMMEVDIYVRRLAPQTPPSPALPGSWNAADRSSKLAAAVARAAGAVDVDGFCASAVPLPDLAQLRREPAAKRELWRSLRSRSPRA